MIWIAPSEKDSDNAKLEKKLWAAADQFRANSGLKSQEYSAPVLGLIFLRFAEVRFAAQRAKLEKASASARRGSRVDEPAAYHAEGILYLPAEARFDYLLNRPEAENIGAKVNTAMRDMEKHNQRLGLVQIRYRKQADQHFIYYLFNSKPVRQQIRGSASGTKIRHTAPSRIADVKVRVPPLPVQRRIAGILSAYDELMENSQRRIRLLEAMARALYREWFVHFRFPGSDKLPSPRWRRVGDEGSQNEKHPRVASPLGDIPQGWECVQLASIIKVTHGYAFQGSHFSDDPTSRVLATPGNFRVGGGIKYDKLKFYREDAPLESAYVFAPMDLMVTMTDLSKAGDTLGFPAFVPKLNGLSFLHNQRVGRVVPIGEFFPKHFLYCLFCDERYRHHIVGGATGMAVKHTSPTRILNYATAIPTNGKLVHAFENFARPVFQQINSLIEAVENLRRTRDLLLPRLLSGQVELKEN